MAFRNVAKALAEDVQASLAPDFERFPPPRDDALNDGLPLLPGTAGGIAGGTS